MKVSFKLRSKADIKDAESVVYPVKFGSYEGKDFFYVPPLPYAPNAPSLALFGMSLVRLPHEFYLREFMELDASDNGALLEFQNKFGRINSTRSIYRGIEPDTSNKSFVSYWVDADEFKEEFDGIEESRKLFGIYEELINSDEKNIEKNIDLIAKLALPVSALEVRATVQNAQKIIKTLIYIHGHSYEKHPVNRLMEYASDKGIADIYIKFIDSAINDVFPTISVIDETKDTNQCPLMVLIFAQLMTGLIDKESFKVCQCRECERLFQYKENGRRTGSEYCSERCQEREKRLRYADRKVNLI